MTGGGNHRKGCRDISFWIMELAKGIKSIGMGRGLLERKRVLALRFRSILVNLVPTKAWLLIRSSKSSDWMIEG